MKEQALTLVRGVTDPGQALNRLREYLQALVLRSFHESEAFRPLAFVGGTAHRFLYGLPRFSEDLDFSLVSADGYAGKKWMAKVKRDLTLAGFIPGSDLERPQDRAYGLGALVGNPARSRLVGQGGRETIDQSGD